MYHVRTSPLGPSWGFESQSRGRATRGLATAGQKAEDRGKAQRLQAHCFRCTQVKHVFYSGWWFGTFGLFFPYIGNVIIPIDFHIFQRGRAQPPTSIAECHPFLSGSMWFSAVVPENYP